MMKQFCVDCKFYSKKFGSSPMCGHESCLDKVTGKPDLPCALARHYEHGGHCGPDAGHFVPAGWK